MSADKPSLGSAYALDGADEVRALYRDWAVTYDADFIQRMNYVLPQIVSAVFRKHGGEGPVLDVGCGSGAVGIELAGRRVDGIDLSPEMLQVAVEKGVYTRIIEADLLDVLPIESDSYRGIVSAGTFTHGHVGPDALGELIRIAEPGALFCLGVNAEHFAEHGFDATFKALHASAVITEPQFEDHPIYDSDHEHAGTRALVAVFRVARKAD